MAICFWAYNAILNMSGNGIVASVKAGDSQLTIAERKTGGGGMH